MNAFEILMQTIFHYENNSNPKPKHKPHIIEMTEVANDRWVKKED